MSDDLFFITILGLFLLVHSFSYFDFLSIFFRFLFLVNFLNNLGTLILRIFFLNRLLRIFLLFLLRLIPGLFLFLNLRELVSIPCRVGILLPCCVRLVDQLPLHAERLDPFNATGVADFLLLTELDLKIANETIALHLDHLVWHTFDVRAFSILLFLLLLILLGLQYFLFDPDLFNGLFARGTRHELWLIADNKLVFPGLLVELFTIGIGWSFFVRFFFLLLSLWLTFTAVPAFTSIPITTVLRAASKTLAKLTSDFSFLCVCFDAVRVV